MGCGFKIHIVMVAFFAGFVSVFSQVKALVLKEEPWASLSVSG